METSTIPIVADVRKWCRIDGNDDDAHLELLIAAGATYAAAYTGLDLEEEDCPAGVAHAIAVFVADNYANREGQLVGTQTVNWLLAQHRRSDL